MYKKVELKDGFVGMERKVAEYWKENNIIKKNRHLKHLFLNTQTLFFVVNTFCSYGHVHF